MKSKSFLIGLFLSTLFPLFSIAQNESLDLEMIYKIKQEGKTNSQIEELSFWMTDFLGPRLTASEGKIRATQWVADKFKEMGFANVVIDSVRPFERGGWDNEKTYAALTAPYYANFSALPKAWTGSTNGLIKSEVVLVNIQSVDDFAKYQGKLKDKIVILLSDATYEPNFEAYAVRYSEEDLLELTQESTDIRRRRNFDRAAYMKMREMRKNIMEFLLEEGVGVILNNAGEFNVPRANGVNYSIGNEFPSPELNLPIEAHGRILRLLSHKVPVEMEVEIENEFIANNKVVNVMGEIPGTDKKLKDQIVLVGGHLDSWHGGTGAADNASGGIVMMEALRILKRLGVQPKRTIRIALWGGEEQGLHGSRGYVEKYLRDKETMNLKSGFDQFAVYFNMDNGTGKFRGIHLQGNEMIRPVFEQWMLPFADMGCSTINIGRTGGTDHLSFDALGLPAFQFIQDKIEYRRGYHTNMDTYERLLMSDLKHNAIIVAAFIYHAAMRDEQLPRKPYIAPKN
ncbi:MAG: M20/M25/M40 family metallo-hydrolase [Bacteroidales bacterium]|jgi:carboxypeptidase Q|nr:M20/M25/M40 family metallo-hydrolase [Bacteroidales bacterium]